MAETITVFDTEVQLEEIRVSVTAVGDGYTATVTAVIQDDSVLGAITRAVPTYTGELLGAATATINELVTELRSTWEPAAATAVPEGQLAREQTFVEAWEASSGDDFASRMARRSLEASAAQTPALQDVLARLRGV